MTTSAFAFALCQPGAERWLKAEVARVRPDLHPGFQRPGLITFKATSGAFAPDELPPTVFGRVWGCSAGPCATVEAILALAGRIGARLVWVAARDQGVPDEVPPARQAEADADARTWTEALASSGRFETRGPRPGELVLDVITSPGEAPLVGWHRHGPWRHTGPAGRFTYEVPSPAPSRDWFKMVEGLTWSRAPLRPGDHVIEIGASPGGATLALAEAGAMVVAVDRKPLDPAVANHPSVAWIARPIGEVAWEDLPEEVRWIACSARAAPTDAIRGVARLVLRYRKTLRGLLLLLKVYDDEAAESLPGVFEQLRALGARDVRAIQLPANRRDVFVWAPFAR